MGEDNNVDKPEKKMDKSRGTWSSHMEFVLSCLGYAVGLGNLWRFPYVCYINGGGAFLIPYFVMLLCVGIPAFLLELSVGQYSSCGPMTVWSAVPLLKGVGVGMVTISSMLCIFYTMLLGYCLHYMFYSFYSDLPWASCQHAFNTPYCYSKMEAIGCEQNGGTWFNKTCYNETYLQTFDIIDQHCEGDVCSTSTTNVKRAFLANVSSKLVTSSEEYLNRGLLEISDNFEETGGLKWQLCLLLLVAWTLCFLCLLKGIHSSGKVVFLTALLPYVILFILLLRGITLPGAVDGILFFITPKWHKLTEPKIWGDAAGQVFFSLSVGGGGLMTFASYSKFHNNIYRDSIIITLTNSLTSIFAGFVVFSILGHMAHELGKPVADVVTEGATLAFVAYPQVMSRLPVPQLWSVLFFLMLLTLGLDSLFATVETVITAVVDCMPRLRHYRITVTLAICVTFFLLGLPLCTRAGIYWLQLIAYYGTGWSLIVMGLVEVIAFPWIYGVDRLIDDISYMIGYRVGLFWWFTWKFLTPFFLILVLIYNIVDFRPLTFGAYELPAWAQAFGMLMTLAPIAMIVLLAVYQLWTCYPHLTITQRLMKLCEPSDEWAPNDEKHRLQQKEIDLEMSKVTVLGAKGDVSINN